MKEDICKECGGIHCDDCGINAEPASQSELIEPLEAAKDSDYGHKGDHTV